MLASVISASAEMELLKLLVANQPADANDPVGVGGMAVEPGCFDRPRSLTGGLKLRNMRGNDVLKFSVVVLGAWLALMLDANALAQHARAHSWVPAADCSVVATASGDQRGGFEVLLFVSDSDGDGSSNLQVETTLEFPSGLDELDYAVMINGVEDGRLSRALRPINSRNMRTGRTRRFWRLSASHSARVIEAVRNGLGLRVQFVYHDIAVDFPPRHFDYSMRAAFECRNRIQ